MNLFEQHQKWIIISVFFFICANLIGCVNAKTGYKCYSCVTQNGNNVCLDNPSAVVEGAATVECDVENEDKFGWCTIVRQEYTNIPGEIVNFVRGCVKKPPNLDGVYVDEQYTFIYSNCRSHLCNTGDGLEQIGGGGGGDDGDGGDSIVVPPEYSSSMTLQSTSLIFLSISLALALLM